MIASLTAKRPDWRVSRAAFRRSRDRICEGIGMSQENMAGGPDDGPADLAGGGAVDRYLGELFDGLAGTGTAGRRALAEAEKHLRAAAADEMAKGVTTAQAEKLAVARFGSPTRIAGEFRRAHRGGVLRPAISGAWLLTGLIMLVFGLTYLVKALDIAVLLWMHPEPACVEGSVPQSSGVVVVIGCGDSGVAMRANSVAGVVALVLTAAVLLLRAVAVRRRVLVPAPQRFPLSAAVAFAAVAVVFLTAVPPTPHGRYLFGSEGGLLGVPMGVGMWPRVIAIGLALLAGIVAVSVYPIRAVRRSTPTSPPQAAQLAGG
jgi:hypothetical protein